MSKTVSKILLDFDPEKSNLLPALKKISAEFGHVGEKEAGRAAEYFNVPLSQVFETASFYDLVSTEKQPQKVIEVCLGPACSLKKNEEIVREIEGYFRTKLGDDNNPKIRLERMSCLGMCAEGPILRINGKIYTQVDKAKLHRIISEQSL